MKRAKTRKTRGPFSTLNRGKIELVMMSSFFASDDFHPKVFFVTYCKIDNANRGFNYVDLAMTFIGTF